MSLPGLSSNVLFARRAIATDAWGRVPQCLPPSTPTPAPSAGRQVDPKSALHQPQPSDSWNRSAPSSPAESLT